MESSQPDRRRPISARQILLLLAFALAVSAVGMAIVFDPEPDSTLGPWVVSGPSMAPTLLGPSVQTRCIDCNLNFRVSPQSRSLPPNQVLCAHCGRPLQIRDGGVSPGEKVFANVPTEFPVRGDLIALGNDSKTKTPFIKRIVGVPGDIVDVNGQESHLTVNGERIDDALGNLTDFPLPTFLVDRDLSRVESRWSAHDWRRDEHRRWSCQTDNQNSWSGWLTYSHLAVYRQGRASPVLDDYPFNVGANRKLIPVDRFLVSGQTSGATSVTIEFAFWTPAGVALASVRTTGGFSIASSDAVLPVADSDPITNVMVDENRPIAIRVNGNVEFGGLEIHRPIQYRLRSQDDREPYPLTVPAGMLFVLGDNVPVSKDSREFGCVSIDQAIGRITPPTTRSNLNR